MTKESIKYKKSQKNGMDAIDLEKLGLSRNEARVYYALIQSKQATASELIKTMGVHRGIVYDNLERLIEKGLVSFVIKGIKKYFVAEEPDAIIEFLNSKKEAIDDEIKAADKVMPEIAKYLKAPGTEESETRIFRGIKGLKKVLSEVLKAKENWCLGMTNESSQVLGVTYWKNYNAKIDALKIKEHFLLNADFKDEYSFAKKKNISFRKLPPELNQVTEIMLFDDNVAIFIYSRNPIAILIKDKHLFETFKQQFDLLWKLSK